MYSWEFVQCHRLAGSLAEKMSEDFGNVAIKSILSTAIKEGLNMTYSAVRQGDESWVVISHVRDQVSLNKFIFIDEVIIIDAEIELDVDTKKAI